MSLRVKLMASLLALSFLTLIVGLVGIQVSRSTSIAFNHLLYETAPSLNMLGQIEASANEMRETAVHHNLMRQINVPSIEDEEFKAARAELENWLAKYKATTNDINDYETIAAAHDNYIQIAQQLVNLGNTNGSEAEIAVALEAVDSAEAEFKTIIEAAIQNETDEFQTQLNNALSTASTSESFYSAAMISVLAGAIVLSLFLTRLITRPITQLKRVASEMASGNYTQRAPATTNDEIGQLASAFNNMANTVQARDTELRKATALAEESLRLKSEFMATMSHELRTPLNAILGFSGIMLAGMSGEMDDDALHMVRRIDSNGQRLLGLINNVLDLAKIEAGRMELSWRSFSPRALVERWSSEMGILAEKKALQFKINVDHALPDTLYGDPERISQIAINLLSNAFKFTERGVVTLDLELQNTTWCLRVSDTGVGIPPHALSYIFDEFRQVDGTSTRAYGGSGLGLSIVRNLCRMMDGTVRVTSELGKGSVFIVTLPLKMLDADSPKLEVA